MLVEQETIFHTDAEFVQSEIHGGTAIDLGWYNRQLKMSISVNGKVQELDIPKDCRYIRPVLVDGKWKLYPESWEMIFRS